MYKSSFLVQPVIETSPEYDPVLKSLYWYYDCHAPKPSLEFGFGGFFSTDYCKETTLIAISDATVVSAYAAIHMLNMTADLSQDEYVMYGFWTP